jgi:hypothetical protein
VSFYPGLAAIYTESAKPVTQKSSTKAPHCFWLTANSARPSRFLQKGSEPNDRATRSAVMYVEIAGRDSDGLNDGRLFEFDDFQQHTTTMKYAHAK